MHKITCQNDTRALNTRLTLSPDPNVENSPCHPERSVCEVELRSSARRSRAGSRARISSFPPRRSRCYAAPYGFDCGRRIRLPPLRMTRGAAHLPEGSKHSNCGYTRLLLQNLRLHPGGRDALRKYACGIFLAKAGSKLCLRPGPKAGSEAD